MFKDLHQLLDTQSERKADIDFARPRIFVRISFPPVAGLLFRGVRY